jgi:hypothetical protein
MINAAEASNNLIQPIIRSSMLMFKGVPRLAVTSNLIWLLPIT